MRDVGMIERREKFRFALEAGQAVRIVRECFRQDLDRDLALQPRIARAIHLTHAAGAEGRKDLVRAEARPDGQGHWPALILAAVPPTFKQESPSSLEFQH